MSAINIIAVGSLGSSVSCRGGPQQFCVGLLESAQPTRAWETSTPRSNHSYFMSRSGPSPHPPAPEGPGGGERDPILKIQIVRPLGISTPASKTTTQRSGN